MTPPTASSLPASGANGRPLLVVHVIISFAIGGLEVLVADLISRARQVRTHVLCLESVGPAAERLAGSNVTVECIGTPATSALTSIRRLRRRLAELAPDVIHTHDQKPHIQVGLATLGWKTPIVHTRHGRGQPQSRIWQIANAIAVRRTRFLVCVSADAVAVARVEGATDAQLRVLLNAIDVQSYDASGYALRADRWIAVTVARLAPVKDIGTMIRAAALIAAEHPAFRLHIVGDGQSRRELEQLTRDLALNAVVTFEGACTNPRPYLQRATLFLQSSVSEGISLTLLEAMAAGLPIVATDVGGNREVVDAGTTGILVPAQNPQALADAAVSILSRPDVARLMSRAARARATQLFDLERMVAEYQALYVEAARGAET